MNNSSDINSALSSTCCVCNTETLTSPEHLQQPELSQLTSLNRLSQNLETIFQSEDDFTFYSDAKIIVNESQQLPIHRCILSARSLFFKSLFSEARDEVVFQLKDLVKDYKVGYDSLVGILGYLYGGKVKPLPYTVCVCVDDECSHIGCRPAVDSMLEVLYASFIFQIPELVALYEGRLLGILDQVPADDILAVLSVAALMCDKACERLFAKCIDITVKSDMDTTTLEKALSPDIVKPIMDLRSEVEFSVPGSNVFPDKHVRRLHRALESDDVELVGLLLKEGRSTLDDAYALHYAIAYCDVKTTTKLLEFGLADVNLRNARGYAVLHVAAMRKEPKIIVSLLTKGAQPSALTSDGRTALQISKRLTRFVDYFRSTEEGEATPKDRLCIEILEQAEGRDLLLGEASTSRAMAGDDLRMSLLYLENRVTIARLLFPMEAKVAMDIAQVDGTLEFPVVVNPKNSPSRQNTSVELNESPFKNEEEYLNRMRALSRTVELGKRFFPRCSEVLDKIMDADDLSELANLDNDNADERLTKKQRYMELQESFAQAFSEDKEDIDRSAAMSPASSSSTCMRVARTGN
ncbi:hypothetical protein IFM89_005518 [Coptis chinensis]|uniref:Regulatory protein NPR1 n=1 Tax=Coptis chinensis TaxID=261450 RepID=A0A835I5S6_9MAGN|nr:hypothetical protein IFM89_005518 [Coptis chinensis]